MLMAITLFQKHLHLRGLLASPVTRLTCGMGEVQDAGGGLQQVGAAGRQAARDGHDGQAVARLLGANDAIILRLAHTAITATRTHTHTNKHTHAL